MTQETAAQNLSLAEQILKEEILITGSVFSVGRRQVRLEDGQESVRDIVYHNGGAAVLPIDDDKNVYLVKQFRSAFQCAVLEIPAGKLEGEENPLTAAVRELQEETGFTAHNLIPLGEMWPTVGYCTEKIYLYLAQNLTAGKTNLDADEFISVEKIPFLKAYEMCLDGTIKDAKTQIAILKAYPYLQKI